MRIWYQVVSSRKRLPSFLEEVQRQCDAVSSPGVTVEVRGTDHGGNGDQFYSVRHLHGAEMLQMAQREFAADRRDVYAMANCLDPVVDELREVLDAPVITFMEAGCFLASLVGDRIGIVAPNTKMVPRLTSIVEHYGYGRKLVGLGALNCDHIPEFDGMFADPALAAEKLAGDARKARLRDAAWLTKARKALDARPASWRDVVSNTPGRLHPAEVFRTLRPFIERDPDAILICDGGEYAQWAQSMLPVRRRLINGVAGAIGSSLSFRSPRV